MKVIIRNIFLIVILIFVLTGVVFRFDKYLVKEYYIYKFCNDVECVSTGDLCLPLEYFADIPERTIKKYLIDRQDFVLVSWIVGLHDARFQQFFAESGVGEGKFFESLRVGAVWLSEFGDIPIKDKNEFLSEMEAFDEFWCEAQKILSSPQVKDVYFDTNIAYDISAAQLGWKKIDAYHKHNVATDLNLAMRFFNMSWTIYSEDNYDALWGLGKTMYLKAVKTQESRDKEALLSCAADFFSSAKQLEIPAEDKDDFTADYIEVNNALKNLFNKN